MALQRTVYCMAAALLLAQLAPAVQATRPGPFFGTVVLLHDSSDGPIGGPGPHGFALLRRFHHNAPPFFGEGGMDLDVLNRLFDGQSVFGPALRTIFQPPPFMFGPPHVGRHHGCRKHLPGQQDLTERMAASRFSPDLLSAMLAEAASEQQRNLSEEQDTMTIRPVSQLRAHPRSSGGWMPEPRIGSVGPKGASADAAAEEASAVDGDGTAWAAAERAARQGAEQVPEAQLGLVRIEREVADADATAAFVGGSTVVARVFTPLRNAVERWEYEKTMPLQDLNPEPVQGLNPKPLQGLNPKPLQGLVRHCGKLHRFPTLERMCNQRLFFSLHPANGWLAKRHGASPHVHEDASHFDAVLLLSGSVLLFVLLCIACAVVWVRLLLLCCAFRDLHSRCGVPASCTRAKVADPIEDSLEAPLLNPLTHEAPITGDAKYSVQVAASHAPPPTATGFVTLAYVPLKGEQ